MDFDEVNSGDIQANRKKNRTTMIILVIVFVAPVLSAYIAFYGGWLKGGVTNEGELLSQPALIMDFEMHDQQGEMVTGETLETHWWWMLVYPGQCDERCRKNVFMLQQTYYGMGKETDRIQMLYVGTDIPQDADLLNAPFLFTQAKFQNAILQPIASPQRPDSTPLNGPAIFVIDTLGNVILKYPVIENEQQMLETNKKLKKDIKRLLKFSRIG